MLLLAGLLEVFSEARRSANEIGKGVQSPKCLNVRLTPTFPRVLIEATLHIWCASRLIHDVSEWRWWLQVDNAENRTEVSEILSLAFDTSLVFLPKEYNISGLIGKKSHRKF